MKVRDKLELAGIAVPQGMSRYHTERGCMKCMAPPEVSRAIKEVPLSPQQYEALIGAGLAGQYGFYLDDPYEPPPTRFV